ncbi:MAG: adenylate/guanylate cyclase domain-containing protein [Pseudomonadota bacterium]
MNKAKLLVSLIILGILNAALYGAVDQGFMPINYAINIAYIEAAIVAIALSFLYAKHLIVFFIMLALAGLFLGMNGEATWAGIQVPMTFWLLYSFSWLIYFEFGKTRMGQSIRAMHPLHNLLFYLSYMAAAIAGCFALTATYYDAWKYIQSVPDDLYILFLSLATLIPTLSIGALKVIDMVGAKHIIHFLLGTYHRPVSRQRIVLFLDMVGSSTIAERLPAKDSMGFVARFIFDASLAFRSKGGDIINYTGDGLAVLWPMDKADEAVESVALLKSIIKKNAAFYKKKFQAVPEFRIGIHAGEVIISQIGEEKLFLGLYGDVVNTAARLEQMCKEIEQELIFSKTVRQYMSLKMKDRTQHLGKRDIRGRKEKIDIFTLT